MPLVNGTQTRDDASPQTNADIISLLIISEILDFVGMSPLRAIAQVGQLSPNTAIGLMESASVTVGVPPGIMTGVIVYIGKEKFFKRLEEIVSFGLSPDGYYVWGNEEKNLPTGEFTADSIFFTGGIPYKLRSSRLQTSIYEVLGISPEELLGIIGWLPGVPNFDWLAVWETPGQTKIVPQPGAQLESVLQNPPTLVSQMIDLGTTKVTDPRKKTDSEIDITTGLEVNSTLLALAGLVALSPIKLIAIPIALAAFKGK